MNQTKFLLLTTLITLLCLSSSSSYHTTAAAGQESGRGVTNQKRPQVSFQNGKSFSSLKIDESNHQGGRQDPERATSKTLRKVVQLLRELKKLLDSEHLLPMPRANSRAKIINLAKAKSKMTKTTLSIIKNILHQHPLEYENELRSQIADYLILRMRRSNSKIEEEYLNLRMPDRLHLLQYTEVLLDQEKCYLKLRSLRKRLSFIIVQILALFHLQENKLFFDNFNTFLLKRTLTHYKNLRYFFDRNGRLHRGKKVREEYREFLKNVEYFE